jgi:hypothetical protein
MHHELTNLLPLQKKRAFKREYFLRLSVVGLLLLSAVSVFGGVLLMPSYLIFTQELRAKETRYAQLEATLQSAQERALGERLSRLSSDAKHLERLETYPSGSAAVRAVLLVPRPGISLTRISFVPGTAKTDSTMMLSGTASTRDTLRQYEGALAALPYVKSSELPISTYAKETELEFIITLTGPLTP